MSVALLASVALVAAEPPDFASEVVPVLTRSGCNAGACHGAAAGRGGLRLSLWGADPAADHARLAFEFAGRRVNLARPERSLLLRKPTGELPHEGGTPLSAAGAARLRQWIAAGAPQGPGRTLTSFVVEPVAPTPTSALGVPIRFRALAAFDNGPSEDVTLWTVFTATDDGAIALDANVSPLAATPKRRGRHVVLARFLDRVVPATIAVPLGDAPVDLSKEPRANFIDDAVLATLAELHARPAPPASDATFVRRVHLDLVGALPSPEAAAAFVSSNAPGKRTALVETLLADPGFEIRWTHWLATVVRNRAAGDGAGPAALHEWLRREVRRGTRMDRTAAALVAGTGDAHAVGPAHFSRLASDPRAHAELVAEAFLGIRLQCANCHNHPLDRWTQDDYHGFAAAFARVERGRHIRVAPQGSVTHPRTGQPAAPRLPGGPALPESNDPRQAVAAWLQDPRQPLFARAFVNRVWAELLGRGLVEPADDLRDTNPASHPALLERLAADFRASGCDLRHVVRRIATSAAYARGPATHPEHALDDRFLSHARPRPLPAEVLADAWTNVLGLGQADGAAPADGPALALADPAQRTPTLELLGRCGRSRSCVGAGARAGGVAAGLHLLNGPYLNSRIAHPAGRLAKLLAAGTDDAALLAEFQRRAFAAEPTPAELAGWLRDRPADPAARKAWLEDLLWAMLNSRRFTHNH